MTFSGVASLLTRARVWNGLVCLTYHRIGSAPNEFDPALWSASDAEFDAQMDHVRRHFDVVTADDLDEVTRRPRGRHVMVTFDDGYRDNYDVALPILCSHGVRATFFIATGFIDTPHVSWWDELAWMVQRTTRTTLDGGHWLPGPLTVDRTDYTTVIRRLLTRYKELGEDETPAFLDHVGEVTGSGRYTAAPPETMWMTWAMVRELRRAGMAIGGHTVHHPVLARLAPHRQLAEITESLDRIEQETGARPRAFSYPVGDPTAFNATTRACLATAGVRYAFGFSGGFENDIARWRPLDLRRVAVETDVTRPQFQSMLALPQLFARSIAAVPCLQ